MAVVQYSVKIAVADLWSRNIYFAVRGYQRQLNIICYQCGSN